MDVILACLLLILLSPLLLLIAILIKLDSPGPVIFSQERVGSERQWLGRTSLWVIRNFRMLKFRSMYQNADPAVHEAYIRDFVEGRARPPEESDGKFKLTNRSEEHTSELQSQSNLVCRLLLGKKKTT